MGLLSSVPLKEVAQIEQPRDAPGCPEPGLGSDTSAEPNLTPHLPMAHPQVHLLPTLPTTKHLLPALPKPLCWMLWLVQPFQSIGQAGLALASLCKWWHESAL